MLGSGGRWPTLRSLEREGEDIEVTKTLLLPSLIQIGFILYCGYNKLCTVHCTLYVLDSIL